MLWRWHKEQRKFNRSLSMPCLCSPPPLPPPLHTPEPLDRSVRCDPFIFPRTLSLQCTKPDITSVMELRYVPFNLSSNSQIINIKKSHQTHLEKTIDLSRVNLTWLVGPSLKWERPPYKAIEVHRDPCIELYMGGKEFIWHPADGGRCVCDIPRIHSHSIFFQHQLVAIKFVD